MRFVRDRRWPWSRRSLAGLACGALLIGAAGCERDATPAPQEESPPAVPSARAPVEAAPSIVFLGDSLTAGLGLAEHESLPALIELHLRQAGMKYRVINAGRSGDTTAGGLSRLDWYFRPGVNLGALVIGLGSNDAMRGLPLASIEENLTRIIRQTRERAPQAKIFLWALETFPNMGQQYAGAYAALFPRLAANERVILIPFPLADVAGRAELNQADGIHPTAKGAQIMARRVWETLRQHL